MSDKTDQYGQVIITSVKPNPEGVDIDEAELLGVLNGTARLFKKMQINEVKYDGDKHWLRVNKKDNNTIDPQTGEPKLRRFFVEMTELVTPDHPIISTINYTLVSGSVTVQMALANNAHTNGSTIRYQVKADTDTDFGEWITGNSVSLASGFANDKDNANKVYKVRVKAIKNGEESDPYDYTITIKPKVAAGSVSVTRNDNHNDYSTQATITFNPSPTKSAKSYYSIDGGQHWQELANTMQLTVSTSGAAGQYKVKAERKGISGFADYADADIAQTAAFTLNKKRFYYGLGAATLANESAIKALAGGGVKDQSTMLNDESHPYTVNVAAAGSYLWFCGTGTLTSVKSGGFEVPMQPVAVVDGYNCYRSQSSIVKTNTYNYVIY